MTVNHIDQIKSPVIRQAAKDSISKSIGDFGMVIEGGVDLERFAEIIIKEALFAVGRMKNPGVLSYRPSDAAQNLIRDHFAYFE
jgi:hypothetical protein